MSKVHIASTKFNNEFRSAQNLNYLLGCFGEKVDVTMEFYYEDIVFATEQVTIILDPDALLVGTLTNRQELIYCSDPSAFNDYNVGDTIKFSVGVDPAQIARVITEKLNGGLIRIGGANMTGTFLTGEYIMNVTPFNGVKWAYNFIQGAANYNSLIDAELQQLKTATADASNVAPVNMFFNGITSYQIGSATVQGVSFVNGRQTFKLIHTTYITPFFLASQWAQLVNGVNPPAYFAAGNCPNYVYKLELLRALNNPSSFQALSVNNPANVGWLNENFNGNPTNYAISGGYTIEKVSDGSIIPRLIFDEELELTITISNFTDSPFSSGNTKYCLNFCYLPENETLYQGNGRTLAQNFVFDRKFSTVGAAVANGDNFGTPYQVIKNVVATALSADQIEIVARVDLGATAESIIKQGDFSRYLIWVTTEDHSLADSLSDKVAILVQVDEFDVVTTVSDLITCETKFIQHPFTDTSDEITDNVEVFPVDDVAARSEFYIDLASYPTDGIKIKTIRPKILLRKAGNADVILDDFLLDVSNYPYVGLAQNIAFSSDRIFKIPAGEVRKVITIARDFAKDIVNGKTNWYINWPFMVRWEYYLALQGLSNPIPADLLDIAEPLQGLNNFWHRFTTLSGWSLKYEIDFTFEQLGDTASQSFTKSINSFDFEGGPAYDDNSITFWDNDTNVELIAGGVKLFQGYKPTRIEVLFKKVFGTFPDLADVVIVIWMEPFESGGTGIVRRISSKYVLDSQSWFLSTDGSGLVVVTSPNPGEYLGVALINPAVIPDYKKFRFYARLYDATEHDCMPIVWELTTPKTGVLQLRIILLSGSLTINWGDGNSTIVSPSAAVQIINAPTIGAGTYTVLICGSCENISSFQAGIYMDAASPVRSFIRSADLTRLESDLADMENLIVYGSKLSDGDLIFPLTNRHITNLKFFGYDGPYNTGTPFNSVLTALDFSNLTGLIANFETNNMRALSSIIFNTATEITTGFICENSALDQVFDFGTKIFASTIRYRNTVIAGVLTQANLDANIDNIYQNRVAYQVRQAGPKTFIGNANNPAPSGTLVAPAGYIQANAVTVGNDGTPANAKEQIYVLINQNNNNTVVKKYNWTFTVN